MDMFTRHTDDMNGINRIANAYIRSGRIANPTKQRLRRQSLKVCIF